MKQFFASWAAWSSGLIRHPDPATTPPPNHLLPFIRWCLNGTMRIIVIAAIITGCVGATEVLAMYFLGRAVDIAAANNGVSQQLGILALAAFVLLILRPIIFAASATFQSIVLGPGLFRQILRRLHHYTLGQAVTYFDNDFAGRISQKQMQTATSLTEVVVETVNAVLFGIASVIGAAILVGSSDIRLLGVLLIWFVGYILYLNLMLPKIRTRAKARAAARAHVTGQIVDTITNIKTVKLFAGRQHEEDAADQTLNTLWQRSVSFGEVSTLFRAGLIVLAGILPVCLVGLALYWSGDEKITPGDIAAIGAVAIRLSQMTGWISFTIMGIFSHIGETEDGMHTLAVPHSLKDRTDATLLKVTDARILFHDVSFGYGRDSGGVSNITLDIAAGEKIGIVGASGAGKSTLVSLLLRLFDTEAGRVEIDGQNIRNVTQESLRNAIGMVTQETAMFNRSARDNIMYGRPSATEADLITASENAEAHEFICDLVDHQGRQGYDAHIGERGVKLSGGQRQRIALARAMLKDAPILVLDEATSALDSEVEAAIQAALKRAMSGKTVLAIAHRLSTISDMDRIIVLENGRIVEEGRHDDLLAKGGTYARYWSRQSGGFLGTDQAAE